MRGLEVFEVDFAILKLFIAIGALRRVVFWFWLAWLVMARFGVLAWILLRAVGVVLVLGVVLFVSRVGCNWLGGGLCLVPYGDGLGGNVNVIVPLVIAAGLDILILWAVVPAVVSCHSEVAYRCPCAWSWS
jgi:hypothetical protein